MKGKLKKIMVSALTCITLLSTTYGSVFADMSVGSVREDIANEVKIGQDNAQSKQSEYDTIVESSDNSTSVYATLASHFDAVIPKKVILDGTSFNGDYTVDVNGDIAANETIYVVPDSAFSMSSLNKSSVTATVQQDKTTWKYNEMDTNALGTVSAEDLTAGSWNGVFYFNLALKSSSIKVTSKNEAGEDLNASASEITGTEKDELLGSLVETGLIESEDEVDALIEVESDDFKGMAETTFDVSSIAGEGDNVAILHYNEEVKEWEYIGTETVNSEGKVTADFSSYSPVAFVKVKEDGSFENVSLNPGLYDANGVLLCTWEESGIDVEKDYSNSSGNANYYKTSITSPYYVMTNKYSTAVKVVLPENISKIGSYAFYSCQSMESVDIPNNVKNIGAFAFIYDIKLQSIILPEGLESIEEKTFYGCWGLSNVTLPSSLLSIGKNAFSYCKALEDIEIPNSVTNIGLEAFKNCEKLSTVSLPDSLKILEARTFDGCGNLTSIDIPFGVSSIGSEVFYECSSLSEVTIPSSVTSIGSFCFYYTNLSSILIPENVTSIGDGAFYGCSNLSSAVFNNTVGWYIGGSAGAMSVSISDSSLANPSTAARYLNSTYRTKYWTRSN